jgi:hypothetical protein
MVGTAVCLIVGIPLVGISVRKKTFERYCGRGIAAQQERDRRLFPYTRRFSYGFYFNRARLTVLAFGAFFTFVGIMGIV